MFGFSRSMQHVLMQQVVELVDISPGLASLHSDDQSSIWLHAFPPKLRINLGF
jgi:hypothetical protein